MPGSADELGTFARDRPLERLAQFPQSSRAELAHGWAPGWQCWGLKMQDINVKNIIADARNFRLVVLARSG